MEVDASETDICTAEMDSPFGRHWSTSLCVEILNTCKEIGSYSKETVSYCTEIGAVSLGLDIAPQRWLNSNLFYHPASQADEQDDEGQVLTHTSLLSPRPLKTVEGYNLDDEDVF